MPIEIKFTADSADELRKLRDEFTDFVQEGAFTTVSASTASAPGDTKPVAGATDKVRQRKPAEAPAAEKKQPVKEEPESPPEKLEQGTFGMTLADVQAKLRGLAKEGKAAAVKQLLDKYGVPNLSSLPEDKLEDIAAEADLL